MDEGPGLPLVGMIVRGLLLEFPPVGDEVNFLIAETGDAGDDSAGSIDTVTRFDSGSFFGGIFSGGPIGDSSRFLLRFLSLLPLLLDLLLDLSPSRLFLRSLDRSSDDDFGMGVMVMDVGTGAGGLEVIGIISMPGLRSKPIPDKTEPKFDPVIGVIDTEGGTRFLFSKSIRMSLAVLSFSGFFFLALILKASSASSIISPVAASITSSSSLSDVFSLLARPDTEFSRSTTVGKSRPDVPDVGVPPRTSLASRDVGVPREVESSSPELSTMSSQVAFRLGLLPGHPNSLAFRFFFFTLGAVSRRPPEAPMPFPAKSSNVSPPGNQRQGLEICDPRSRWTISVWQETGNFVFMRKEPNYNVGKAADRA